ncbi:hypothetical protein AVEN_73339-1 [Araneus ventricosus]|uniref:Uncharacterized protein n=1 Tax=Araneus ventricosus TaxID=182803 RepID=A0A4Y2X1V9_ARAVE|nr:hypothetical protein AVEN_73339-1 [Araneus ventricosus]
MENEHGMPPPVGIEPPTFRLTAERASPLRRGGFVGLIPAMAPPTQKGCKEVDPRSGEARAVTGTQKIEAWKAGSGLEQEQSTGTQEEEEVSRGWIEDQEGASRYFVSLNY